MRFAAGLRVLLVMLLAGAGSENAAALTQERAPSLAGHVFDSVANRPLAQARVQLVSTSNPVNIRFTRTDSAGRFVFDSLESGSYLVAFEHPRLDTLLLEPITQALRIEDGRPHAVTLAVPSQRSLVKLFCGDSLPMKDFGGLLLGRLHRADRQPVGKASGSVVARWHTVTLDGATIGTRADSSVALVSLSSAFAVCGLPSRGDVTVTGRIAEDSSMAIVLELPTTGVLSRDLYVPVTGGRSMTMRITGLVRDERGGVVPGARVESPGFGVSTTSDSAGRFTLLTGDGTQPILVRAIGHVPHRLVVDVFTSSTEPLDVRLSRNPVTISTVTVRDRRSFAGFEERRTRGTGIFLDEETLQRRRPQVVGDLFQSLPGVAVGPQESFGRRLITRSGRRRCEPHVFVNGAELLDRTKHMDAFVDVGRIRAIEIYPVPAEVPKEFVTDLLCGAIIIWTRL